MTAYREDLRWNTEYSTGGVRLVEIDRTGATLGDRILDARCFCGFVIGNLNAKEKYGIETNAEYVTQARRDYPDVRFSLQNAAQTDFPDGFFDSVVCMDLMELLRGDVRLLNEMRRILKPGGRLFVSTVRSGVDVIPFRRQLTEDLHRLWKHERTYSDVEFKRLLESSGFKVMKKSGYMRLASRIALYAYVRYLAYAIYKKKTLWRIDSRLLSFEKLLMKLAKMEKTLPLGKSFRLMVVAVKESV